MTCSARCAVRSSRCAPWSTTPATSSPPSPTTTRRSAGAIVGANRTFGALASQSQALSDTFKIFPTFENEGRLTLDRLKGFAEDARPVFHDLRPVARDLSPTLRDVRTLAPEARRPCSPTSIR